MVAPADPKGIVKASAPKSVNYSIDSWGYVFGRYEKKRKLLGYAFFIGGAVVIIVLAWLLTRFGSPNAHEVQADEFYRAAQMSESELTAYIREHDIKTVLRLVGGDDSDREDYEADKTATEAAGAELIVAKLPTSRLPYRSELATLFEALDKISRDEGLRPVLVHCRQGSDRTGLVSTIWLHDYQNVPLADARKQLAFFPYMHFAPGHKVEEFLNQYAEFAGSNPGVPIKQWVRDHYTEEKPGRERTWYVEGC